MDHCLPTIEPQIQYFVIPGQVISKTFKEGVVTYSLDAWHSILKKRNKRFGTIISSRIFIETLWSLIIWKDWPLHLFKKKRSTNTMNKKSNWISTETLCSLFGLWKLCCILSMMKLWDLPVSDIQLQFFSPCEKRSVQKSWLDQCCLSCVKCFQCFTSGVTMTKDDGRW